jgi:hypothetical protein
MSHEAAMAICISEKPQHLARKYPPLGDACKLVGMMKRYFTERKSISIKIQDSQQLIEAPLEHALFKNLAQAQELKEARAKMQARKQQCQLDKERLEIELSELDPNIVGYEQARQKLNESKDNIQYLMEHVFPAHCQAFDECDQAILAAAREIAEKSIQESEETLRELDKRKLAEVTAWVKQAGTDIITSSNVLHFCAYSLDPLYLHLVVNLIPNAATQELALNSFDQFGKTPLMSAACSDNFDRSTVGNLLKMCQLLIQLGADKNMVDASGLTALGWYRKTCRANRDCYAFIGGGLGRTDNSVDMERLLLPFKGPTVADDALLEDSDDALLEDSDDELVDVIDDDWEDEDD